MPKNKKNTAPVSPMVTESTDLMVTPVPATEGVNAIAQLTVQNESMVAIGIAARETELESAIAQTDVALKPLIAARDELSREIAKLLEEEAPKAAEWAARVKADSIVTAFAAVGKTVKATITPSGHRPDGSATANVKITDTVGGYDHIDFTVPYALPAQLVEKFAASTSLDQRIGAGRTHQVQLKAYLSNLGRDERRIRAAMGTHALEQSEQGRALLNVIARALPATPVMPESLLALGNGDNGGK